MNFISIFRNHYEKFILACLLIIFAVLLYWQLLVIQEAQNKRVDQIVNQKDPDPDYELAWYLGFGSNSNMEGKQKSSLIPQMEKKDNRRYLQSYVFDKNSLVWEGCKDKTGIIDMMTPEPLSVCPKCKNFIPASCFPPKDSKETKYCPFHKCNFAFKARQTDQDVPVIQVPVADDADNNGLPDKWEQKYNILGSKDQDPDKDGFTNLEEYHGKTDPTDPKSHPLYVTKLRLAGVPKKERLESLLEEKIRNDFGGKISLKGISAGSADKNKWEAEFCFQHGRNRRILSYKVGEEIFYKKKTATAKLIPSIGFKVLEIVPGENRKAKKDGNPDMVVIGREDGLRLECYPNKTITTPYEQIEFVSQIDGKKIMTQTGRKISLGNETCGIEEYTVSETEGAGNQVKVILTGADGKKHSVKLSSDDETPDASPVKEEAGAK